MISGPRHPSSGPQGLLWPRRALAGRRGGTRLNPSPRSPPSGATKGCADTDDNAKSTCRIFQTACEDNGADLPGLVAQSSLPTIGSAGLRENLPRVATVDRKACSSGRDGQIHVQRVWYRSAEQGWANSTFSLFWCSPISLPTPAEPMHLTDQTTAKRPVTRGGAAR